MSSFRVDLPDSNPAVPVPAQPSAPPAVRKPRRVLRILAVIAALLVVGAIIIGIGAFAYWQTLKSTPQYSLAVLVAASRDNDQPTVQSVIDFDAVVDDFTPQVTAKAVEMYGRGVPPTIVSQITQLAAPIMPAVKEMARTELPGIIKERVDRFPNVPFPLMVLGASRYLDITIDGDSATVKSKVPDQPLELKMRRKGDRWQIVGLTDDALATQIATKIGKQIITLAMNGGVQKTVDVLNNSPISDLLKKANSLLNK